MTARYLPDARIEDKALRLLNQYGMDFGAVEMPPVPVEDIADGLLDLRLLWESMIESPGTTVLAGLDPNKRIIKFNESRRQVIEETQGLYNTVLGHEIGHWELHVDPEIASRQQLPQLEGTYQCLYQESTCTLGSKETQAHRFMGFLLMPSYLLREAIRDVELTNWVNLYTLRDLFQVTISALRIRLERLGVLYVASDGQLYPSQQEYHGQTRLAF